MALDLMPVSTEAPRCSEFARTIDVLPPGTGLYLERVVLVSVPLPWPKPALKHDLLAPVAPMLNASPVLTRLFAMEPPCDDSAAGGAIEIAVEVYERSVNGVSACRWLVGDADTLQSLVAAVADTAAGHLEEIAVQGVDVATTIDEVPPTFLVCTQGTHDTCCGTSGVALADAVQASRGDYVVRRVSHTGGHRFSPTLLALPSGRMWAFVDLDLVDRIAATETTTHDYVHHARGWWGTTVGPAQVAETAVRAERPDLAAVPAIVEPLAQQEDRAAGRFLVTVGEHRWNVTVEVGRTVPTVACETPGGLPAKPGREFAWTIAPA